MYRMRFHGAKHLVYQRSFQANWLSGMEALDVPEDAREEKVVVVESFGIQTSISISPSLSMKTSPTSQQELAVASS